MDKLNSNDEETQPEENTFVSLDDRRVQRKFMEKWNKLRSETGRGYVTAYMNDGKYSNSILHLDDRETQ